MLFRFIGDPRNNGDGPAAVDVGGVMIGRVEFVDVTADIAARLAGNNHFEMVGAESASPPAPRPVAVNMDEKEALIAQLEALGVDVDRRWGMTRLNLELQKATDE